MWFREKIVWFVNKSHCESQSDCRDHQWFQNGYNQWLYCKKNHLLLLLFIIICSIIIIRAAMCTFTITKEFTIGSQLSPCGHLAITDTPLIRTTPESPAKIRHLTETNSRYCAISLLRTYGHLSRSLQHCFIVLTLVIKDINQHLSTFRQYYLNFFSFFSLRLCHFGWKVNIPIAV